MTRRAGPQGEAFAIGNRLAPARFVMFLALLPAIWLALGFEWPGMGWQGRATMAFDGAAAVFLASLVPLLRRDDVRAMRRHSAQNDANRAMVLLITTVLTFVVMAAISAELPAAKAHDPAAILRLMATLVLIWVFANSVYALHYAHAFYASLPGADGDRGGLDFPGTKNPDYGDFFYFAFTLGMTFQTSDVAITAPGIRRIALLHSFAAFVFNIGVIAFTINTLGGSN